MRSLLFVPGVSERKLEKALRSGAETAGAAGHAATLERFDRVLGRTVGGDHDRLLAPAAFLEPAQHVLAVVGTRGAWACLTAGRCRIVFGHEIPVMGALGHPGFQ